MTHDDVGFFLSVCQGGGEKGGGHFGVSGFGNATESNGGQRTNARRFIRSQRLEKSGLCGLESEVSDHARGIGANFGVGVFEQRDQVGGDIDLATSGLTETPDRVEAGDERALGSCGFSQDDESVITAIDKGELRGLADAAVGVREQ